MQYQTERLASNYNKEKIDAWVEQQAINSIAKKPWATRERSNLIYLSQSSHYEISAFWHGLSAENSTVYIYYIKFQCEDFTRRAVRALNSRGNQRHGKMIHGSHVHVIVRCVKYKCLRWLIYYKQFGVQDDNLSPRDVLVMCPAIENYSPYIEAVFGKSIQSEYVDKHVSMFDSADRNVVR